MIVFVNTIICSDLIYAVQRLIELATSEKKKNEIKFNNKGLYIPEKTIRKPIDLSSEIVAVRNNNRKGVLFYKAYFSARFNYYLKKTYGRTECFHVNSIVGGFRMKEPMPRIPDYMNFLNYVRITYKFCDLLNRKFGDRLLRTEEMWNENFDKIVNFINENREDSEIGKLYKKLYCITTGEYKKFRIKKERKVGFPCIYCFRNFVCKYHKLNIGYENGYYIIPCLRCKRINRVPKNVYLEVLFAIEDFPDDLYVRTHIFF